MRRPFGASRSSPGDARRELLLLAPDHAPREALWSANRERPSELEASGNEANCFQQQQFCLASRKYFRAGMLDGTRGGKWGQGIGGCMLDVPTTRGAIEVGGL